MDALDHKLSSEISEIKKMLIALHRQMENQRICESQPPLAKVRLYSHSIFNLLRTSRYIKLRALIALSIVSLLHALRTLHTVFILRTLFTLRPLLTLRTLRTLLRIE